ncbi:MAG: carboxymuconolactone decarboxylase family protein [Syntrophobacteraceae bacterium]
MTHYSCYGYRHFAWGLIKALELNETTIPGKYKHLIGIGASAAIHCRYCSLFHTEMAKVNGATEKEIEEAVHLAKQTAGWSAYMYGLQEDRERFENEIRKAAEYLKKKRLKKAA